MTQFVVCLDRSGSMEGNRIITAKNLVNGVENCSNNRSYYWFSHEYKEVTKQEFYQLNADGGTRIEETLHSMFDKELPRYKQKETRFFFVTDADDSINNPNGLKQKYQNLGKQFKNGLHSKVLLIASGGCKKELDQIFGDDDVYYTMDKEFKKLAENLVSATKLTTETKNNIQKITNILNNLSFDSVQNLEETQKKINLMENDVKSIGNDVKNASTQIEAAREHYNKINDEYGDKVDKATNAVTEEEIENSENDLESLQNEYQLIRKSVIEAQTKANKAERKLIEEQIKADKISENIKKNDDQLKNQVQNIKNEIANLIKKIKDIKKFDPKNTEIKSTRKEIKEMTKQARLLTETSLKEFEMIQEMEKNILNWFKIMRNDKTKAKEMKSDIELKLNKIDEVLDTLYDKA